MSESKEKHDEEIAETMPWYVVWMRATFNPSDATYEDIIDDPNTSTGRALLWVAWAMTVARLLLSVLDPDVQSDLPFYVVSAVVGLGIYSYFVYVIALAFGGTGTFEEQITAIAAITAVPLIIGIGTLLIHIPGIKIALWGLLIFYVLFLVVKATRVVHQFGWFKAMISAYLLILLGVLMLAGLTYLGSQIQNVFSEMGPCDECIM